MDILSFILGLKKGMSMGGGSSGDTGDTGGSSGGMVPGDTVTTELKFKTGNVKTPSGVWTLSADEYAFAESTTYANIYAWEVTPAVFTLAVGTSYRVSWDRGPSVQTATTKTIGTVLQNGIVLGNTGLLSGGTGVPYLICYSPTQDKNIIFTSSTAQSHDIGILQPQVEQIAVTHGMDEMPDLIIVHPMSGFYANDAFLSDTFIQAAWGMQSKYKGRSPLMGALISNGTFSTTESYGLDNMSSTNKNRGFIHCPDELTFKFGPTSASAASILVPGSTYQWLAISGLGASAAAAEDASF